MMATGKRCAVYTRKSSEEGLEQSFNSLEAQREACEAYIKSQAHEGWQLVSTAYNDGGYSGGNIERPGLRSLLEDVKQGRVDIIVVYKVDRLTRSLADFAKIVEVLDALGASFVSVTQQFNTTSSMGRLTLNVLLSFAQFEREVTGERIRDKFAASKRRGMWMGGNVPLGYDVIQRRLVLNESEAKSVRYIFETYVALGTVEKLEAALRETKIVRKVWISAKGNRRGGTGYRRGALYYLLRNAVYAGLIPHKGELYPAQHEPIISRDLWDRVQAGLRENCLNKHRLPAMSSQRPLAGLLYDDRGNIMSPSFTKKKDGRRYPCYVSQAILQNRKHMAGSVARIPAEAIEAAVAEHAMSLLDKGAATHALDAKGSTASLREAIGRVVLSKDGLEIFGINSRKGLKIPGVIVKRGRSLTFEGFEKRPSSKTRRPTAALVKAICRASSWREKCDSGEVKTYYDLARLTGFAPSYVRSNMQLAFLAPDVVEAVIENRETLCEGVIKLTTSRLPLSWHRQLSLLGPGRTGGKDRIKSLLQS